MATLNSLPNEILIAIAEFYPSESPHHQSQYLAALALTSRRLNQLCNPILYSHNKDKRLSSAVVWAVEQGRIDILEKALFFGLNLNARDSSHHSSLYIAVKQKQEAAVTWLLDHGVPTDDFEPAIKYPVAFNSKSSPLFLALSTNQASIAQQLIERDACLTFATYDRHSTWRSAIHVASYAGLVSMVRYLIQRKAIDINMPDSGGKICLHYAIRGKHDWAVLEELIQLGANVNCEHPRYSLLCYAIKKGHFKTALGLIDAGSRVNDLMPSGLGPIHMCTWEASRFPKGLSNQQQSDKYDLLKRIISLGTDLNGPGLRGSLPTPLGVACCHGTIKAMAILLQAGADVNREVGRGETPVKLLLRMWNSSRPESRVRVEKKIALLIKYRARLDLYSSIRLIRLGFI